MSEKYFLIQQRKTMQKDEMLVLLDEAISIFGVERLAEALVVEIKRMLKEKENNAQ